MARKSSISVSSRADSAKTANAVLARRLASGNINGGGTREIPLKEPEKWYTRIENTLVSDARLYEMVHVLGYEPLTPADLSCSPEQAGFRVSEDGNLVRGPANQIEMAFKMPKSDRKLLEKARTEANLKGIGSAKTAKRDMAESAAATMGSEAADYIDGLDGQVVDQIIG